MTPIRSAHPSPIGPDADERSLVYRKTEAGRQALAARRGHMALRDRQIVLLCTGERNVVAMTEVFGPDTPADLRRLVAAGLIEAAEPTALKAGKPGTPAFRKGLRDALEAEREVAGAHGVFNMSANDHFGLDERARVLVRVQGGEWKVLSGK